MLGFDDGARQYGSKLGDIIGLRMTDNFLVVMNRPNQLSLFTFSGLQYIGTRNVADGLIISDADFQIIETKYRMQIVFMMKERGAYFVRLWYSYYLDATKIKDRTGFIEIQSFFHDVAKVNDPSGIKLKKILD